MDKHDIKSDLDPSQDYNQKSFPVLQSSSQDQSIANKSELPEPQQETAAIGKNKLLDRLAAGLGTGQVSEHSDDSDDEDSNEEKVHVEGGLADRIANAIRGDPDSEDSQQEEEDDEKSELVSNAHEDDQSKQSKTSKGLLGRIAGGIDEF